MTTKKKTTTKKVVKKPAPKPYTPKSSIAKLFKNRNKRSWKTLEQLEDVIVKFLDTCWETHDMQIGTGKTAKWEQIEMFIVSKGLFRAHLGVSNDNIKDWLRRNNETHRSFALAITQAEQMVKEQLKAQVQRINKKEYTDAIKWLLATTWKEWEKESTADKLKAVVDMEKRVDTSEQNTIVKGYLSNIKEANKKVID